MHGAVHGQSPSYINDVFVPLNDLPGHSRLRSAAAGQYDVPFTRTQFGRRAMSVAAPTEWNNLPANLRSIADITAFKKAIRTLLLDKHIAKLLDKLLKVFALVLCSCIVCKMPLVSGVLGALYKLVDNNNNN